MENINEITKYSSKLNLLYVEDDAQTREFTSTILREFFDNIIIAKDGEDGYEKFKNNKIDLIITDINMPKMDGLEMLKKIKKIDKDILSLILSAYDDYDYLRKSIKLNVEGYLIKPIDMDQFCEVLKKIIQKIVYKQKLQNNISILEQYQNLADHSAIVSKSNPAGIITYANDEFCKISEYTREELIGKNHNIIRHPDNPYYVYQNMWDTIKNKKQIWKGTVRNISKYGKIYYVESTIKPILDMDGKIIEYIALRYNITDIMSPRKQLEDFLYYTQEPILFIIEIIDYEMLEKFYGYSQIGYIERQISKKVFDYFPEDCIFKNIYVLGNGKFAFASATDDLDVENIINNVKSILNNINTQSLKIDDTNYNLSVKISLSYGTNVYENCLFGLQKLLRSKEDFILANNLAMHQYKQAQTNLNTLEMLSHAIENLNIVSHFQPIVSNKTQQIVKYESLVRLVDKDGNILAPSMFLDISKQSKYYFQITKIVLKNSFDALHKTSKDISINLSALDIEEKSITDFIFKLLDENKEHSHRVVFELLEDENIQDMKIIEKFILKSKEYGVKIAIDDFGAGYSNFERLLSYQPDILKIDGSLIKNILIDNYSLSVVKTIIAFAKAQDIELIGEFVENEEIYSILNSLGVEYSQGYYFGKPDALAHENYEVSL